MSQIPENDQLPLFPETAERDAPTHRKPVEDGADADERDQHDLVFKTAFHQFFADLVELAEPGFAGRVDLANVEFLEQETFSDFPKGLRREADIVAKLTSRDGEGRIVLVQVEVEGEFRTAMDERSFYYYLHLRIKYRLPVLLIVVFLRGGKKGLQMREFVDEAEGVEVCRFKYVAFSLEQNRSEDFVDLPQPLAPGLAALMRSDWDAVEKKLRCLQAIRRADVDEARRFLLAMIVDLYVELNEAQAERFSAELEKESNKEVREMVITWEDALAEREAKGEAKGETKGEAKGEAKGLIKATRNHILRILQRRLESVPSYVRQKVEAIQSLERLEEILDQAVVVSSVDELVIEP